MGHGESVFVFSASLFLWIETIDERIIVQGVHDLLFTAIRL